LEDSEGRRVEEVWFKHARMKTTAFWGPLSPQKPNTMSFWGPLSPHTSPTRRRFGDHFHPKSPTRRRFNKINKFLTKFPTWTSPFFLSFSFFYVSVDKWVWAFFTTSDINMVNI
jgi:hypothetical protein